mgnify:FL=1
MSSIPYAGADRQLMLSDDDWDLAGVEGALRRDSVVIVSGVTSERADAIVAEVAERFALGEQLKLQSAFASIFGHRENVGKNFMSVNRRGDYEYVTPHSEGTHSIGMQLASFYGLENTTDGGHTLLFNVNERSAEWPRLRAVKVKMDAGGRPATQTEIVTARVRYGAYLPKDIMGPDDEVLEEIASSLPGRRFFKTLSPIAAGPMVTSGRTVMSYWDNIGSADRDACDGFIGILRDLDLLRLPEQAQDQIGRAHV